MRCFVTAKECFEANPEKEWCMLVTSKIVGEPQNYTRMSFILSERERNHLTSEEYEFLESLTGGRICNINVFNIKR